MFDLSRKDMLAHPKPGSQYFSECSRVDKNVRSTNMHEPTEREYCDRWIKGHNNHTMNELCDRMAKEQAEKAACRSLGERLTIAHLGYDLPP